MVTIEEARKMLGPKYKDLPDEDLNRLLYFLDRFASYMIDKYMENPNDKIFKKIEERKKLLKQSSSKG